MANQHSSSISLWNPWSACALCSVGFDSALSEQGRRQLQKVQPICVCLLPELQAVLYSPLQRAAETAHMLFRKKPESAAALPSNTIHSIDGIPWVPVPCLMEQKLEEHLEEPGFNVLAGPRRNKAGLTSSTRLRNRIKEFLAFAWDSDWDCFAVVGHSLWYRAMVGIATPKGQDSEVGKSLTNASVWRLTFLPPLEPGGVPQLLRRDLVTEPVDTTDSDSES
eukprot:TRINITY_DN111704_c0_g1_i1.p1 TRINITY_DN111704_c0_g1~~TRINITY_DN111704_c0_g1_i1.p1  ORF type:complete len:261 (+),score=50.52 TRINITY_DN111704_c0_g1_i1:119-784(+)